MDVLPPATYAFLAPRQVPQYSAANDITFVIRVKPWAIPPRPLPPPPPPALQSGDRQEDYATLLQGSTGPVPSQSDPSSRRPTAGLVASDNLGNTHDDFRGLSE